VSVGWSLAGAVGDLSLAIATDRPAVQVGETATLTVSAANAGPDATSALVGYAPPAGLDVISATATQGAYNPATGAWATGTLAAEAAATLTLAVRATAPGALTSTTEITDAPAPDPDSTPANAAPGEDDQATATITATAPLTPPTLTPTPTPTPTPAVVKVAPDSLSLSLSPRSDRKPPFSFTASGRLTITRAALRDACTGRVVLTVAAGKKTVLTQAAPLRLSKGDCRYKAKLTLRDRKRIGEKTKTLKITAAFPGNQRLTASTAKTATAKVR